MPPLPMITLQPEISNQRSSHWVKRKEAVAVTAPISKLPSGCTVAAGEQWKLTLPSSAGSAGRPAPSAIAFL